MQVLHKPDRLAPYVKEILLLESTEKNTPKSFPFYADGFPGIIFSKSSNPFYLKPSNKQLSNFYLYGQTVEPISLDVFGEFKMIILKLYPFAASILLGVNPKILVDDCYDLLNLKKVNTRSTVEALSKVDEPGKTINLLADYFDKLILNASYNPDYQVKLATNLFLKSKGTISVKEVRESLHIAERTFERHFAKEIGVSPKQFARIIQFSTALNQITEKDYALLSDVGYDSGFADQSHFIRTFKQYTGKTPKEFQHQISK